ncbi:MAG: hypothetical protein KGL45_08870, partial [Gammaproteobacteria bacterium]|nr:hypothetical protein [Gammaproteobacteria bacterium]
GDVYLCSGQSNMEYPTRLASDYDQDVNNATHTLIRLLHIERFRSVVPRNTFGAAARWDVTSPQTVREFSAVCYFFGRDLQPAGGVPIGLIESAWGGSVIQATGRSDFSSAIARDTALLPTRCSTGPR